MDGLTVKQRQFVEFYCGQANCNATEAARLAGYSEKTAAVIGAENLRKPYIRAAIDRYLTEKALPSHEVLARLSDMARASIADLAVVNEDNGSISLDFAKAQREGKLHLIAELAYTEFGPKVKLHDAQSALVHLGRCYGLFKDRQVIEFDRDEAAAALDRKIALLSTRFGANGIPGEPHEG